MSAEKLPEQSAPVHGSSPGDAHPTDENWRHTAVAAFFLAEARGFLPGHELDDWLAAERQLQAADASSSAKDVSAAAVEADGLPEAAEKVPVRRARKTAHADMAKTKTKAGTAGAEPPKKKTSSARKATTPRTRKSTPGIEAELGGTA